LASDSRGIWLAAITSKRMRSCMVSRAAPSLINASGKQSSIKPSLKRALILARVHGQGVVLVVSRNACASCGGR
jgi:adenine/guanine phosphoribosyltransferase-like PRPP-binding protein